MSAARWLIMAAPRRGSCPALVDLLAPMRTTTPLSAAIPSAACIEAERRQAQAGLHHPALQREKRCTTSAALPLAH